MSESPSSWTARDGSRFGFQIWLPEFKPRAMVVGMHGLGCREQDFAPLGEMLRGRGIAFAAWNLRGQGLDPVRKRRGAWLDVAGILEDLEAFIAVMAPNDVPLFLCGESMGALLALQAAVRKPWSEKLVGVLLFSPVVGLVQKNPPWIKWLLRNAAAILPGLRLEPGWFVHGSAAPLQLTRVPERQQYLDTAPHRLGPLTLRFLNRMGNLIEFSQPAAENLRMPVAVFSAGHDVYVTPEQTREFFTAIRSADKTHFHYAASYHQLLFDLDAPEVVADAAGWIEARLPKNTSS